MHARTCNKIEHISYILRYNNIIIAIQTYLDFLYPALLKVSAHEEEVLVYYTAACFCLKAHDIVYVQEDYYKEACKQKCETHKQFHYAAYAECQKNMVECLEWYHVDCSYQ